jgi:parvulin-like peptidyl-prolyl isomerase
MLPGLLLLLPLFRAQAPAPRPASESPPFLRIEGQDVSADEFVEWLLEFDGEPRALEYARKTWAVAREAARLGIDVGGAEVATEVDRQIDERVAGAFRGSREQWIGELDRTGRTVDGIRRQRAVETLPELQARAIASLDRVVPEVVIRREWELRHGRGGRRYDLRLMRFRADVPSRPDMDRETWEAGRKAAIAAARERALAARGRVLRGEDFGLVAARESDDPDTRDRRGEPPGGFRDAGWPGAFLDELAALAPGALSEPIFARGGWWLVDVRAVRVTPLEDVRASIEADLVARGPEPFEVGTVLDRVAEGLDVEVLPAMFEKPAGPEWPGALEPVLRIDGEPVTRGEYARWLFDAVGETLVDTFVGEWLVARRARAERIEVDEAEVAARTEAYIRSLVSEGYRGDREAWVAYLELGGRTEKAFVRGIARRTRVDLLSERLWLRDRSVSVEELRARFARSYGPDGARRDVRTLRCPIRNPDPPAGLTREELQARLDEASAVARRRAEDLAARARAGEDFAQLVQAADVDLAAPEPAAAAPERFRPDSWSETVARAVAELEPGQVTDPQLFADAWWVLELVDRRAVAFEEVRAELESDIRSSRPTPMETLAFRNQLRRQARVERLDSSGR